MTVFSVCLGFAATSQAAASSQVPGPIAYARALCMLDLDDAQKARIAQVFKEHRPEFQTLRQKMQACRQDLNQALLTDKPDQEKIIKSCRDMAVHGKKLALLLARVIPKIRAELNERQLDELEKIKNKAQKMLFKRARWSGSRFDKWIDRHAGKAQ
jgi:Skp family chaperone for outer membrane proteins